MFSKWSFRKKIAVSQILSFLIFFAALFPLIEKMVPLLVRDSLIESTIELKNSLKKGGSERELIAALQKQEVFTFFRISIIDDKGKIIFDSHKGKRLEGSSISPGQYSEIEEAREKGVGYVIATSEAFGGKFAYVAERFIFQGKPYILRTAFPYKQIQDLTDTFEIGMLSFSFIVLLFFNALIWLIFNRFTRPIRETIDAITPYQREGQEQLPEIRLSKPTSPNDEFHRLVSTFNALSKKIQEQIDVLKVERNEKSAILESLGEGVIAVNEKMEVLYANFLACKMLEIHRREILGRPLSGTHELVERCRTLLSQSQEQQKILTESLSFGDGKKTYIDLIAAPKDEGTGSIIVIQDKTNHYHVLEMGKDFVANASHELRTPITIIKGYTEALRDMRELSPEQFTDITKKIEKSCTRMEGLVNSLLTLADIENLPEGRFQDCDLMALLENCRHIVRAVYKDAHIEMYKETEQIIIGADAGLLELAFTNLLDNAAKYSDPPAKISITLKVEDEEALIQIADQGRGIPAEDLEFIFERFYRVDKTHSRRLGGAGLGLSIVKTIMNKHDGTINVSSELGKGTTFTITLPVCHHGRL